MKKEYTIIVPRADYTGPTNVAVDIGSAAVKSGWSVTLLYLSGSPIRSDLSIFKSVRRFRFSDLLRLKGIVHSHGFRPDLVGWMLTWNPHCTVVTTLHGHFPGHLAFDYPTYKVLFAWCLWSKALHRFDRRICISNTMIRFYERQFRGLSFDLAYNFRSDHGEKHSLPSPQAINWIQKQRSENRIVLLYAGSLSSRKNTNALLDAVLSSNDLSLMICGDGPERIAMSQKVELRSPENQVFFAGHVNNVKSFLNQCDMLVLPSHAEGLPLVVLEAASLGIPSLMSNLAIHRELASKGFGETFNRHSFFDLRCKALLLKADRKLDSDTRRVNLWKAQFSPLAGFGQYEKIFDCAK